MRFTLFLLVNGCVFLRPGEVVPWLREMPVYEVLFLTCLAVSYPLVAAQFAPKRLAARPINVFALGMLAAIIVSHLANGEAVEAWATGWEFTKVFLYYILFVSVVDSPKRLEQFLTSLALFAMIITVMALLNYHNIINMAEIQFVQTSLDDSGSAESMIRRLGSTGVFADPNDMCLMLVLAMTVCLYQVLEKRRYEWVAPLAIFGHALMMTHSRGGFLAMLAGLVSLLLSRYGRKALLPGVVVIPAVFAIFAGRQTNISANNLTGLSRLALWSEGIGLFARQPFFGIGSDHYADHAGHVAHNSFIHCYTELGLFGGTMFLAAFYVAIWALVRLGGSEVPRLSPDLSRLRPYVLAMIVGYAVGLLSLSCPYTIPTYTVLGLGTITIVLAEKELGVSVVRLNRPLLQRLTLLSLTFAGLALLVFRVMVGKLSYPH